MSNSGEIIEVNNLIKKQFDLDIYEEIIKEPDPSNTEWQKKFNNYYDVIKRDKKWQNAFYKVFKEYLDNKKANSKRKQSDLFEEVLTALKERLDKSGTKNTSRVEASFCSKMLATIYPEKYPVIDENVFSKMNFKLKRNGKTEDRIRADVEEYNKLCERYFKFIKNHAKEMQHARALFESSFPECKKYSDIKIIDFFLWKTKSDENPEILNIFDKLL